MVDTPDPAAVATVMRAMEGVELEVDIGDEGDPCGVGVTLDASARRVLAREVVAALDLDTRDRAAETAAIRKAADSYEAETADVYWRDDSPFHANGRSFGGRAAEWLRTHADRLEADDA